MTRLLAQQQTIKTLTKTVEEYNFLINHQNFSNRPANVYWTANSVGCSDTDATLQYTHLKLGPQSVQ